MFADRLIGDVVRRLRPRRGGERRGAFASVDEDVAVADAGVELQPPTQPGDEPAARAAAGRLHRLRRLAAVRTTARVSDPRLNIPSTPHPLSCRSMRLSVVSIVQLI